MTMLQICVVLLVGAPVFALVTFLLTRAAGQGMPLSVGPQTQSDESGSGFAMAPYLQSEKETEGERPAGVTLSYVSLAAILAAGVLVLKLLSSLNMLGEMLVRIVN